MFQLPADLTQAKILVTNDDGIRADGIAVLEKIARGISENIWVVAPETEQSCQSHSLTLERPLRIKKLEEKRYCIDGTPSDCMLLAINHIFKDSRPDLVLSGVNFGRNAGVDVTYSGTIAAAMEATLLGVPAIAFSQEIVDGKASWDVPETHAENIVRKLVALPAWPERVLMNVNFPNSRRTKINGMKVVSHLGGKSSDSIMEREGRWGDPYFWVGHSVYEKFAGDTDGAALEAGYISVTPLHMDMTHYELLAQMREQL